MLLFQGPPVRRQESERCVGWGEGHRKRGLGEAVDWSKCRVAKSGARKPSPKALDRCSMNRLGTVEGSSPVPKIQVLRRCFGDAKIVGEVRSRGERAANSESSESQRRGRITKDSGASKCTGYG